MTPIDQYRFFTCAEHGWRAYGHDCPACYSHANPLNAAEIDRFTKLGRERGWLTN